MENVLLPITDILKISWEKVSGTKGSTWAAIGIIFLIAILSGVLKSITVFFHSVVALFLIDVIFQLIIFLLQFGMVLIGIKRAFNLPFSYRDMFVTFDTSIGLKIIGLLVIQVCIYLVAFIPVFAYLLLSGQDFAHHTSITLFVLGGLEIILVCYFAIKMYLAVGYIVHLGYGPITAIKSSFIATSSNFWRLVGLTLLIMLIIIVSAIPLGIGLIWTFPLALISYGEIYKFLSLKGRVQSPQSPVSA